MSNPEKLEELKKATLASYIQKAAPKLRAAASLARDFEIHGDRIPSDQEKTKKAYDDTTKSFNKDAKNRMRGIKRAAVALAKEEKLEELNKNTLSSYISKAIKQSNNSAYNAALYAAAGTKAGIHARDNTDFIKSYGLVDKRTKGIKKAASKLAKEEVVVVGESSLVKEAKSRVKRNFFNATEYKKYQVNAEKAILNNHQNGFIDTNTAIRQLEKNGSAEHAARLRQTLGV